LPYSQAWLINPCENVHMAFEIPREGFTPDQQDLAISGLGRSIYSPTPRPEFDLPRLLGTNHSAYQFVEERAIQQLQKTPTKEVLINQLEGIVEFVRRAQQRQDDAFHDEVRATNGYLSASTQEYLNTLDEQTYHLTSGLEIQRRIVQDTNPGIVHHIQKNLTETVEDMQMPMEARIRLLASRFSGRIQIVTDGDGTLTTNPGEYLHYIPGSEIAEQRLEKHSRDAFPRIFVQNWREPLQMFPHLFKLVGREFAHIRDGAFEFIEEAKQNRCLVTVLTANFETVTRGFMDQNTHAADKVVVWGVTPDDITSTDKENALRRIAYALPDNPVIAIGDGETDIPTGNANDIVLVYFALKHSDLEAFLQKTGARYISYETLTDIAKKLEELGLLANDAQPS
jgi:2-hydroxy-3-keto-5-methylthiopentenyl-1-phosphate phosphatase